MKCATLVFLSVLGCPVLARAADADEDAYARVVVTEAELRAGPGVSHRVIYRAPRGETFLISTRETAGFWLQVTLPDGRTMRLPALPLEMDGQRLGKRLDIPRVGEHSAAIAKELGCEPAFIEELIAEGVLGVDADDGSPRDGKVTEVPSA